MSKATAKNVSIFCVDIEKYSDKSDASKVNAQELLSRLILEACEDVDLSHLGHDWLDGGDGGFLLLEGPNDAALVVLEAFASRLTRHNSRTIERERVHVRYALHAGLVRMAEDKLGPKYTSDDIIIAARMLDGMDRRKRGQVVCSGVYRDMLVRFGDMSVMPFKSLAPIVDKHGTSHEVWNLHKPNEYGVDVEEVSVNP